MKIALPAFALLGLSLTPVAVVANEPDAATLWYRQPATTWNEALPIGNGRLGAMLFGGVNEERLQLNEDTLWSGAPHDYNHPGAFEHLAEIRKLIAEQKFPEAEKLGNEKILGIPKGQASYQPLGDLKLGFSHHGEASSAAFAAASSGSYRAKTERRWYWFIAMPQ
jgi:alpha-L-fucosidase 2